jgi:hypothetical protein
VSVPTPKPEPPQTDAEPQVTPADTQPLRADEFYFEGPYMVFTEAYHLRRGYCCNSDCRHCPYR